jgi:hypothetical protein
VHGIPKQLVTAVLPDTVTRYLGELRGEFKEKTAERAAMPARRAAD